MEGKKIPPWAAEPIPPGALICNGPGGMQCPLPTHSQAPVGGAGNGSGGSISPSCLCVCWCRKCRLLEAAAWPAPGRGCAGSSTSQPSLCTLLPKVCWRAQPAPWHGWLQPNTISGLAPATTPFPGSPLPFTPHHKQCLLPELLRAVCFWQRLRKDQIECKYNYSSHPGEEKELWLTEVARGLLTRGVTSCSSLPPPLPLHHCWRGRCFSR